MRQNGKLDYLELPGGKFLVKVKHFYSSAFGWTFTDYGPQYSAFGEGLDGGFNATGEGAVTRPLPVLFSDDLEKSLSAVIAAGGRIVRPIFSFPGGRRFHFADPAGNELAVWAE